MRHPKNLSVPARMLTGMSNRESDNRVIEDRGCNDRETTGTLFADPVAYLAQFGIVAEVTAETSLPAAA